MADRVHEEHVFWELRQEAWQQIEQILMREGIAKPHRPRAPDSRLTGVLVVKDPHYIVARAPLADERDRVLKHGETFAVFDRHGDIRPTGLGEEGLYHEGTRFLSCSVLKLGPGLPFILSSTLKDDNAQLTVDLTNPDIYLHKKIVVPRGTVHLHRAKFLWEGCCHEQLKVRNYGLVPLRLSLSFEVAADFADIFEVRGEKRKRRGELLPPVIEGGRLVLAYRGLDEVVRRTRLEFSPSPSKITEREVLFDLALEPHEEVSLLVTVACEKDGEACSRLSFEAAAERAAADLHCAGDRCCQVFTSNEQFNDWLNRSLADLHMMNTDTPHGPYPYAGVPWFSTAFGRDGIITALECLWMYPDLARGVLGFLADAQATELNAAQDAEPGKVLHETRKGEMAALGEIPFGRYYGSIDSTPLFVMLAGAYFERTGDRALIERIWPNLERALNWIDEYGDQDGDGFVEYFRHSADGLVHQGWKDSHDSVFHADGSSAEGPIALCEVQGYVYAAKRAAADLADMLGRRERAAGLKRQAGELQEKFERAFWCEDIGTYALALDGEKRPCKVRTSNAGHCLFTGIAAPERARRVMASLLHDSSFRGWGIRTVAEGEARYNPMSYHNGSIWPHDNALIARGLSRYGFQDAALRVLSGLFDVSLFVELNRMPELFCGFPRRPGEGPTLYPVACAPQAWAAAATFLLLQACLGLSVQGNPPRVCFSHARLPGFLKEVWLRNLRVGDAAVDLRLQRHEEDVGIEVLGRKGELNIVTYK